MSYFTCTGCDEHFCNSKCGGRQIEEDNDSENEDEEGYHEELTSCILCRLESATPNDLLQFLLTHFNLTHEQAIKLYRENNE
jgi:hypothetical protein